MGFVTNPSPERIGVHIQPDRGSDAPQYVAVPGIGVGPSPKGKDESGSGHRAIRLVFQRVVLPIAEALLAVLRENLGDWLAGSAFDLVVQVNELPAESAGDRPSEG